MIEDEAERINKAILKREKALESGQESKVKKIEDMLEEMGFEVKDTKDATIVKRKKKASI